MTTNAPISSSPGPMPSVGDAFDTTLAAAQRNILANSQGMVARLNADLLARFRQAYEDYRTNMQSGQNIPAERQHAPVPPHAWELAPPNEDGFVFYQISATTLVANPADYPDTYNAGANPQPNTTPNMIMIGSRNGTTNWFTALKGDTFPSGMKTPPEMSADGVTGIFEKYGAPVGPGWYLLVG